MVLHRENYILHMLARVFHGKGFSSELLLRMTNSRIASHSHCLVITHLFSLNKSLLKLESWILFNHCIEITQWGCFVGRRQGITHALIYETSFFTEPNDTGVVVWYACFKNTQLVNVFTSQCNRWNLATDKYFHLAPYNECNCSSMLGLKLSHVN